MINVVSRSSSGSSSYRSQDFLLTLPIVLLDIKFPKLYPQQENALVTISKSEKISDENLEVIEQLIKRKVKKVVFIIEQIQ